MYEPEIEYGKDFAEAPPDFKDLQQRVEAAMRAVNYVESEIEVTVGAQSAARAVFSSPELAEDSDVLHNPASIVHIKMLLSEYDRQVVHSTATLRNYVTNKLLEESDNPDPRIRMKALELLGKISDVGLFTEKTEITYKHRPTEELERLLQEKLAKVIDMDPVEPALAATETRIEFVDPETPVEAGDDA